MTWLRMFRTTAQELSDATEREKERARAKQVDERTWQLQLELQAMTSQEQSAPARHERAQ